MVFDFEWSISGLLAGIQSLVSFYHRANSKIMYSDCDIYKYCERTTGGKLNVCAKAMVLPPCIYFFSAVIFTFCFVFLCSYFSFSTLSIASWGELICLCFWHFLGKCIAIHKLIVVGLHSAHYIKAVCTDVCRTLLLANVLLVGNC